MSAILSQHPITHFPPEEALQHLVSGAMVTQLLAVAAQLGLADILASGPLHYEELASKSGSHPDALYRILRALAGHGVFAEDMTQPGQFHLTPMAELLRADVPGSLRNWAMLFGAEWLWLSVGQTMHSVRTGSPAFEEIHGTGTFQYFEQHPHHGNLFFATMNQITETVLPTLLDKYEFSGFRRIMDIGGGLGALLAAVLSANPQLKGVLFDLPFMVPEARGFLESKGVGDRCELIAGSFFDGVPEGADLHMLKWIIHDWNDEQATAILRNCRQSLDENGRLLLIEQVVSAGNEPCPGKMMDITMMLMEGGRERSEAGYALLLEASGFKLSRRIPLLGPWSIIEAEPT